MAIKTQTQNVLSHCVTLLENVLETIDYCLASVFSRNYRSFSLTLNTFYPWQRSCKVYLIFICKSVGVKYIRHQNIRPDLHLNASKLYLNKNGNPIFVLNLKQFSNNLKESFCLNGHTCISLSFNNMYSDEKNFLSISLSDLSTCDHFADDLKHFRIKNLNKIIIAKININCVRNKFDLLLLNLKGNIDIMLITETKNFS